LPNSSKKDSVAHTPSLCHAFDTVLELGFPTDKKMQLADEGIRFQIKEIIIKEQHNCKATG